MRRRALVIGHELADQVLDESARYAPRETGGVLLGTHPPGSSSSVVTELVGAGHRARRESHRFTPDGPWQRRRIAERYEASGRTLAYLGDWHSHPAGNGPSKLDRATARLIADTPAALCPHPIFLIATRVRGGWELRAYRLATWRFRQMSVERR